LQETFKAAVLEKINYPLSVREIVVPELKRGQVLVKNIASGICRSQLMEVSGGRGEDKWLPHLLGHEGVGKVVEVGDGVTKVKKGDKVILSWIIGDGLDSENPKFLSKDGSFINSGAVTTFSEYSIVPENRVFMAPKKFADEVLPLFGCAFLTGGGMVISTFLDKKPKGRCKVLVLGFGGVGIAAALVLRTFTSLDIYIVEVSEDRRNLASKLGFSKIFKSINLMRESPEAENFDYCFEATGNIESIEDGFSILSKSGILTFASHPERGRNISLDPFDLIKGKRIRGTWGGDMKPEAAMKEISRRLLKLNFDTSFLVGPSFNIEQVNTALNFLRTAGAGKPIIWFGESK